MRVELLFWHGCPSHPEALADLRAALAERGLDPSAVDVREVDSDDDAARERFVGSPTTRVDGAHPLAPGAGARALSAPGAGPAGLTCRVYRLRDGRFSPTPDPDDLRDALDRALAS